MIPYAILYVYFSIIVSSLIILYYLLHFYFFIHEIKVRHKQTKGCPRNSVMKQTISGMSLRRVKDLEDGENMPHI